MGWSDWCSGLFPTTLDHSLGFIPATVRPSRNWHGLACPQPVQHCATAQASPTCHGTPNTGSRATCLLTCRPPCRHMRGASAMLLLWLASPFNTAWPHSNYSSPAGLQHILGPSSKLCDIMKSHRQLLQLIARRGQHLNIWPTRQHRAEKDNGGGRVGVHIDQLAASCIQQSASRNKDFGQSPAQHCQKPFA